jgi:hypothetical protein
MSKGGALVELPAGRIQERKGFVGEKFDGTIYAVPSDI